MLFSCGVMMKKKILVILLSLGPLLTWAQCPEPHTRSRTSSGLPGSAIPGHTHSDSTLISNPYRILPASLPADSLPSELQPAQKTLLRQLPIPVTLIALGIAGSGPEPVINYNQHLHGEIREHYPGFSTGLDDYTRHLPVATAYALNLAGLRGTHDLVNLTAVFILSDFINSTATSHLKRWTRQSRPDLSGYDAFPSGHTSAAFMGATVLYLEFKDQSMWYGAAGYVVAAATGGLRMLNKKHWLSDVLAGAGVGILSTRAAYGVYPWIQKKIGQTISRDSGRQLLILPGYAQKTPGICLLYTFE